MQKNSQQKASDNLSNGESTTSNKTIKYTKEQTDNIYQQMYDVGITKSMLKDIKVLGKKFETISNDDPTLYAFMRSYVKDSKYPNILKLSIVVNEEGQIKELNVSTQDMQMIPLIKDYNKVDNIKNIR